MSLKIEEKMGKEKHASFGAQRISNRQTERNSCLVTRVWSDLVMSSCRDSLGENVVVSYSPPICFPFSRRCMREFTDEGKGEKKNKKRGLGRIRGVRNVGDVD